MSTPKPAPDKSMNDDDFEQLRKALKEASDKRDEKDPVPYSELQKAVLKIAAKLENDDDDDLALNNDPAPPTK